MIGSLKLWINSMLCIGIFVLFIKLVIPNNSLKKYIYSMIGIITIITIISPVAKLFMDDRIEESLNQVINNISNTTDVSSNIEETNINKYRDLSSQAVRMGFIEKLKEDIKNKLEIKGVLVEDIDITMNSEYEIAKIVIKIDKYSNECPTSESVQTFIKNEYDIDSSKVKVRGE